ncbi:hypothetical protein J4439_01405 [Candidatus Woesearchaeota archaeon]|nr:hypothetical protein [Candidatus Woesearchaeota archaeon]
MSVTAVCRKCGGKAASDTFRLDYKAGYVVCPNCYDGARKNAPAKSGIQGPADRKAAPVKPEAPKPAGWDADDAAAEKLYKQKQRVAGQVESAGVDRLKFSCPKCSYSFTFHKEKWPKSCPYCDTAIHSRTTF